MNRNLLFITLLAAAVGCLLYFLVPSEEKKINKQLHQLSLQASKSPDEQPLEALSTATTIGSAFSDPCLITSPYQGRDSQRSRSRKEITDLALLIRKGYTQATVTLYNLSVTVGQNKTAEIIFTVGIEGKSGQLDLVDLLEVHASMTRIQGKWRFTRLALSEALAQ